jgi:acetyl-CoA C-acetyltransferase
MKDETKVEMDGAFAVHYGLLRALAGHHKLVLVWGGSMPSCYPYSSSTLLSTDPTFERPLELINDMTAGAFQMRAYMNHFNVSAEDIAQVAVKNRRNAASNELALPESQLPKASTEMVLKADILSSPVTELMYSHPCDGAACILLAPEQQALKIRDDPVWITGVGYSQEAYYLGDRDLTQSRSMKNAAQMAYKMAGVKDPKKEIDVAEVFEHFAHEEVIFSEALGFCKPGEGATLSTEIGGELPINPSGGAMSGNTPCATGMIRLIEAAKQIHGEAAGHQVKAVHRAVASGQIGFCAQNNILFVLEGGGRK